MLSNFKLSSAVKIEKVEDKIGGGSFILESGIYPFKVDVAYLDKNDYGNTTLNVRYTGIGDNSKAYRETISITDKDGNIEVKDKNDVLRPYYGFTKANALLGAICGKELHEIELSPLKLKIYDFNAGGEVMVEREVLTELTGMPIKLGITKNVNNKKKKEGAEWVNDPSGAIKETNKTHTAFRHQDLMTSAEIIRGDSEAKFHVMWLKTYEGETQGKVTPIVGGMTAGAPGATPAAGSGSLKFDDA